MMGTTITFLSPDSEQGPCSVTVGVVAGTLEIDRVAESFRGLVDVLSISDSASPVGCEAVFRQCENQQEVEILLPLGGDQHREHRIMVSVAASPFSALDSVAHAVLAPAFAPGGVGVDWDDVCSILRLGKRAVLVMAKSAEAVTETLMLAESVLAAGDRAQISGVMAAVFASHGATWMEAVRQVGRAAETLAPDAWRLVAAPIILGDTPVCSVFAVLPE